MEEYTFLSKVFIIIAVLVIILFVAEIWVDRVKADDRVSDESEGIYLDRDVLGQPKGWLNPAKNVDKNALPTSGNPSVLLIIAAMIMIWALFF